MKTGHRRRHRPSRIAEREYARHPDAPWWKRSRGQLRHHQPRPLPRYYPRRRSWQQEFDHYAESITAMVQRRLDRLVARLR